MKTLISLQVTGDGTARLTLGSVTVRVTEWRRTPDGRGEGVAHLPTDDPQWPEWVAALAPVVGA